MKRVGSIYSRGISKGKEITKLPLGEITQNRS